MHSIREALIELGQRRVRSWATLLLLTEAAAGRRELALTALHRASMCEALARSLSGDTLSAYTVGLLSVVDALLDCTLAAAVEDLPIDAEVAGALVEREGWIGNLLGRVTDYERGDFVHATRAPLDPATLTRAYLAAIESSTALMSQVPG